MQLLLGGAHFDALLGQVLLGGQVVALGRNGLPPEFFLAGESLLCQPEAFPGNQIGRFQFRQFPTLELSQHIPSFPLVPEPLIHLPRHPGHAGHYLDQAIRVDDHFTR